MKFTVIEELSEGNVLLGKFKNFGDAMSPVFDAHNRTLVIMKVEDEKDPENHHTIRFTLGGYVASVDHYGCSNDCEFEDMDKLNS